MEDKLLKQNYLRSEIIEKGYNPDEFIEFLDLKIITGEFNIDNFQFQELKDVNFIV